MTKNPVDTQIDKLLKKATFHLYKAMAAGENHLYALKHLRCARARLEDALDLTTRRSRPFHEPPTPAKDRPKAPLNPTDPNL